MAPRAFSSMVDSPPSMLSPVGWLPRRSTPQARMLFSILSMNARILAAISGVFARALIHSSPPNISVVSAAMTLPPASIRRSATQPTHRLEASPLVTSLVPQLTPKTSLASGQRSRFWVLICRFRSTASRVALAVALMAPPSRRMLTTSTGLPAAAISWAISSAVQPCSLKWSITTTAPAFGWRPWPAKVRKVWARSGAIWQRPKGWTMGIVFCTV